MDDVAHEALEAARERVRTLEARVRELEARLASIEARPEATVPTGRGDDPSELRADALFTRLRQHREAEARQPPPPRPKPKARRNAAPTRSAESASPPPDRELTAVPDPDEPASETPASSAPRASVAPEPPLMGDDLLRARRDAVLEPLAQELIRVSKRQLQDEQNVLLDAARRANARVEPAKLLPEPAQHRDAWGALLSLSFDSAYGAGRGTVGRSRRPAHAPERLVNELAVGLIAPLRERLQGTVSAVLARGPYESTAELHREMAAAIGARYREWKGEDLDARLGDALAVAYARGTYDAAPSGAHLRWVPDAGEHCPDCDDNALEVTVKGQCFPTGQAHPPAHPGCRCLVVSVVGDGPEASSPI